MKALECKTCRKSAPVSENVGEFVCDECYGGAMAEACDTRDQFDGERAWTWLEYGLLIVIALMGLVYVYLCAKNWI